VHELNEDIRDREIRLIGEQGEQLGIMSSAEALKIADEQGLDLVKISPQAVPRSEADELRQVPVRASKREKEPERTARGGD
jgi:translation initiation factor IF-3